MNPTGMILLVAIISFLQHEFTTNAVKPDNDNKKKPTTLVEKMTDKVERMKKQRAEKAEMMNKKKENAYAEQCTDVQCKREGTVQAQPLVLEDFGCSIGIYALDTTRTHEDDETKEVKKKLPEDRYSVVGHNGHLAFAVFDGHGGSEASEYAKQRLLHRILTAMDIAPSRDLREVIKQQIRLFDDDTCKEAFISGTTAVIGILFKKKLYIANLGDSRAVLWVNGKMKATTDHKPTSESERTRIRDTGVAYVAGYHVLLKNAFIHVDHHKAGAVAVSRAIGDKEFKHVKLANADDINTPEEEKRPKEVLIADADVYEYSASDVSYAVLGSDGLWDKMGNKEAMKIAIGRSNTQITAKELGDQARKEGSTDDITVIVVKFFKKTKERGQKTAKTTIYEWSGWSPQPLADANAEL